MTRPAAAFPYWLLGAVFLAYFNAVTAAFQFDDYRVIVDNPAAHGLSAWWAAMPGIRPLLKLSYALNWKLSSDPLGFHAVNLLLHLANVVLVWRLSSWFPGVERDQTGFARLVATLLFALHPIQTETVTYVTGRSMSLMALFGLAALLAWLEAPNRGLPRLWRGLALALFTAALAVKEIALTLPLLLLLLDPAMGARPLRLTAIFLALASLLGLLGYAYLLTETPPRGLLANLASETNALFWLMGQLARPWALNIDPDLPEYAGFSGLPGLQLALLLALAALAWRQRRRFPPLAFGLAWTALLLAPMYTLIPRLDLANERHLYLAGLGLYWIAGVGLAALISDAPRRLGIVLALVLASVLLTAARNQDYQDEVSLWRATVARSPYKDRAWNNLGYAYALAGRKEEARTAYLTALRLNPRHPRAGHNLRALEQGRQGPS